MTHKKLPPINISHMERASSCPIGEKVRVDLPGQKQSFALSEIAAPYPGGHDQFLDFSEVKGMTFRVPVCPCTAGGPLVVRYNEVKTPQDFAQLRGDLGHSVWMENEVCWRALFPSTVALPENPLPPLPPDILQNAFKHFVVNRASQAVSTVVEAGLQNIMRGSVSFSLKQLVSSSTQEPDSESVPATILIGAAAMSTGGAETGRNLLSECEDLWIEEECANLQLPDYDAYNDSE